MGGLYYRLLMGSAVALGGIYLYKKYKKQKHKEIVAHTAGLVLGDKLGGTTGWVLGGPGGALVGSVAGAVAGAVAAEKFFVPESDGINVPSPNGPTRELSH